MVSQGSSEMVVAWIGKLYAERSFIVNLGGDKVFGETGGESSYREWSASMVLCEVTDDSSGIVANADWKARVLALLVRVWYMQLGCSGSYSSMSIMLVCEEDRSWSGVCMPNEYCCNSGVSDIQLPLKS
jgi:hypothetical protein